MLSLYIHIPFCYHKCAYCSFFVVPEDDDVLKEGGMDKMKQAYMESLLAEHRAQAQRHPTAQIKTIYIGGGTPFQLGADRLFQLIDDLLEIWDVEFLEELSIELNPDPMDEVIAFVAKVQKKYKDIFRLRFSFGIQTLDDQILKSSKRNYFYNQLIHRFRELVEIKTANAVYNLDFIAFGDRERADDGDIQGRLPRDQTRRTFFESLVKSHIFDGFSVYTLELFPGAEWYYDTKKSLPEQAQQTEAIFSDDETIRKEFQYIKNTVMNAGYHRYEISNFALRGKRSLHNMVYWTGGEYLALGINASGMLCSDPMSQTPTSEGTPSSYQGTTGDSVLDEKIENGDSSVIYRYKNTNQRKKYLSGEWMDTESIVVLSETEQKSELVMLGLRTDGGIVLEQYRNVLVDDIDAVIADLTESGHISYDTETDRVRLTDRGLDVYNSVLMEVLEKL